MATGADFTVRVLGKTKGAKDVEKALGRVRNEAGRFVKGAGAAERATGRFTDKLGRLREANGRFVAGMGKKGGGGVIGSFSVMGGNLMTKAVEKVGAFALGVAGATLELIAFGQNSRLALGNLAKHGAEPEKLFEHARSLAVRFGLDVMDTTKQYQKFLALQFSPKAADKLIRMGADLQALGNSAEDVKGVFMALGQIKGKGRLQGEEMLQLAERGISTVLVQEEIGKILGGKTTDQVRKLQEAGKVTADVGLLAIEQAINRKLGQSALGESGARFADKTFTGMLNRIKSIGQDTGISLVDKITGPLTAVTGRGLESLERFLGSPEGAATISRIADGLGRAAEFASTLAGSFAAAFGSTFESNVRPLMEVFGAFSEGDSTAMALGRALGDVAAFSVAAATGIALVGTAIGVVAGPIFQIGKALLEGLINPFAQTAADMYMWVERVGETFNSAGLTLGEKALGIGKALVTGLANGVWSLATLPGDALVSVAGKALSSVKDALGIHSPSRVTMAIGGNMGRGLALGVGREEHRVSDSGRGMAAASLSGMDQGFGPAFGPSMSSFGGGGMDGNAGSRGDIHFTLHQEIHGGGGDAEEIGRIAARESRREVESFFRQMALEV